MENQQNLATTPKKFISTLKLIHLALIVGPLFLSIITVVQSESASLNLDFNEDIFILLIPAISIGGAIAGIFLAKKKILELSAIHSLKGKLMGYQTASIIKYALAEGPAMLSAVFFMQTANLYFIIFAGVNLAYLATLRPTKSKIETDLQLNHEQLSKFNQSDIEID